MNDHDNILVNIFFTDSWHFNLSNLNKYKKHYKKKDKYINIINYISNRYSDSQSFKEILYRMKYHIDIRPICKECGNPVKFVGKSNVIFRDFCCCSCAGKSKLTIFKKQESDKKKHDGKLGWNVNCKNNAIMRKKSLISKYGSYKNAIDYIEKRRKEGILDKYGVSNLMELSEFQIKRNDTLRKNHKSNTSKAEEIIYKILIDKFGNDDVIRSYSSEEYHWNCDFYIKSKNLYIEYQGSQFHNHKPYLNTIEDKIYVEFLTQKSKILKNKNGNIKNQYDMIIYVWTDLDVRKRNCAKENHLNFKELWTLEEAKKYIQNL